MQFFNINPSNICIRHKSVIFIFQYLIMESLEPLSSDNLEVMGVEINSVNCKVINIDRNKIESIPKINQVQIY